MINHWIILDFFGSQNDFFWWIPYEKRIFFQEGTTKKSPLFFGAYGATAWPRRRESCWCPANPWVSLWFPPQFDMAETMVLSENEAIKWPQTLMNHNVQHHHSPIFIGSGNDGVYRYLPVSTMVYLTLSDKRHMATENPPGCWGVAVYGGHVGCRE